MKLIKYNHFKLYFSILLLYSKNGCAFLSNIHRLAVILILFLISCFQVNAQFFVANNTSVYIEKNTTLYVKTDNVYLFSKIDNNGKFILDNTLTLTTNDEQSLCEITFINKKKLSITSKPNKLVCNTKAKVKKVISVSKAPSKEFAQCYSTSNSQLPCESIFFISNYSGVVTSFSFKKNKELQQLNICILTHFKEEFDSPFFNKSNNYTYTKNLYDCILKNYLTIRPPPFC